MVDLHPLTDYLLKPDVNHAPEAVKTLLDWLGSGLGKASHYAGSAVDALIETSKQAAQNSDQAFKTFTENHHLTGTDIHNWANPKLQEAGNMLQRNLSDLKEGLPTAGEKVKTAITEFKQSNSPEQAFLREWDQLSQNAALAKQAPAGIPSRVVTPDNTRTFLTHLPVGSLKI